MREHSDVFKTGKKLNKKCLNCFSMFEFHQSAFLTTHYNILLAYKKSMACP